MPASCWLQTKQCVELEEVAPLHRDAHVGHHGVHRLVIFLGKGKDLLHDLLIHVDLKGDAVGARK